MTDKRIRVLNVLDSFGRGGAETFLLSLLDVHDRSKFDWAVCALTQATPGRTLVKEFERTGVLCRESSQPSGEGAFRYPIQTLQQKRIMTAELKAICREFRPDVVHSHLFWPSFMTALLLGHTQCGLVTTFHNTVFPFGRTKYWMRRLSVRYAKPVCVACSEAAAEANVASGMIPSESCVVVSTGVNTEVYNPEIITLPEENPFDEHPNALHVLQVGSLEPRKGYEYTIEALSQLTQQGILIQVCCIGMGEGRGRLERLAKEKGVADRIRFLVVKEDEKKKQFLRAADVYIMPSLYEGLSLAMLEAMAMKLPMVASAVGGAAEVVEDGRNGFLIASRDSNALAERLAMLAADAALRKRVGEAARETTLTRYSLAQRARQLEQLYRDIVARKAPGKT